MTSGNDHRLFGPASGDLVSLGTWSRNAAPGCACAKLRRWRLSLGAPSRSGRHSRSATADIAQQSREQLPHNPESGGHSYMSSGTARRSLLAQFSGDRETAQKSKMAADRLPHEASQPFLEGESNTPRREPQLQAEVCNGALQHTPYIASPASTESLLQHTLEDILQSPQSVSSPGLGASYQRSSLHPSQQQDLTFIFSKFAEMLDKGLAHTATKITSDIKNDLQLLGNRIDAIESKVDATITRVNQNSDRLQDLHNQLDTALAKIDDLENRSRRYNFRIRGLPENITEVQEAVQSLIRDLIPDIHPHKLELDRAHRALGPPRQDGLPRDIVVKPHYYGIKEEVMKRARSAPNLQIMGHHIQIFADISPATIQRRRGLKPLLTVLQQQNIKYWWLFPFSLKFEFNHKSYRFATFLDGEILLKKLGIISTDPPSPMHISAPNASNTSKRPPPASPLSTLWQKTKTKKAKDGSKPPKPRAGKLT